MENFSQQLWNQIVHQAEMNMKDGHCSLYRHIYIPMKVKNGEYNDLSSSEKIFFYNGIRNNYWHKDGEHIDSNPFRITEVGRTGR